ncbi:MAG: ribonuclease P protein subunit, partial [Thermoplasmata archaeon]|nr:ribonuclease P protein subunit [Thermoplasmata archaeon]
RTEVENTQAKNEVIVAKKNTIMKLTISQETEIELDCSKIIYRPEDRIKKLFHKKKN